MKKINWKTMKIRDAAAAVNAHLNSRGIEASLVGGACVSIYSIEGILDAFKLRIMVAPQKAGAR